MSRSLVATAICFIAFGVAQAAQQVGPPIVQLKIRPDDGSTKGGVWNKPALIKTADDAAKHFSKDNLATLMKTVDFKKQFVLIFAWQGSGNDKLSYTVAESFPEQITFSLTRGETRDLRSHVQVFALRSNVRWSIGKAK